MTTDRTTFYTNAKGHIVAWGITEEQYMQDYAADFCEWINGTVIKMSPVHAKHDGLTRYLATLLDAYFERKPVGQIRQAPFVMVLPEVKRRREPDIQVILDDNPHNLTPTDMQGAADIVIEIVSPESIERDYGEKLHEYERGGVPEYWIIDPVESGARFYRLNDDGAYVLQEHSGTYSTSRLPGLQIDVAVFWQDSLPGPAAISQAVAQMLQT
jgi:Uma2 family endonuclease